MTMATVALVHVGGTIGLIGRDRLDLARYVETRESKTIEDLLEAVPEIRSVATVRPIPYETKLSHALTLQDLTVLSKTVSVLNEDPEIDGVVISHGTNTLEETAYFLGLTVSSAKPVVVCGAMRPWSGLSSDGPLNLLNAVRTAANVQSRNRGVLVVFDGAILSARDATKTSTESVHAFTSAGLGPLGSCSADGEIVYYRRVEHPQAAALQCPDPGTAFPRVDVIVSYVGADGTFVEAAVNAGARGIISAGTGAGVPTPEEEAALNIAAATGIIVCQASRVGTTRISRGSSFYKRGWVAVDDLNPWKARLLLSLILTQADDKGQVQNLFDSH